MKKGRLISRPTKKGSDYLIEYDNGKSIKLDIRNLNPSFSMNDLLNQEVEFDNSGGNLSKIWLLSNKQMIYEFKRQGIKANRLNQKDPARAPYNFVPLNKNVVVSNGSNNFSIFERQSGYMDIKIVSKSPLFIRGGDKLFSKIDNCPVIPGSSLRGLIRNIVNIISYGKLNQFSDRRLFRRSNMVEDGANVNAGFLRFDKGSYKIFEATAIQSNSDDHLSGSPHSYEFDNSTSTCKFSVGEFQNKCRVWVFTQKTKCIGLADEAIKGYESDNTRSDATIDILKSLKKGKIVDGDEKSIGNVNIPSQLGVPVFYRADEGKVISFGHAKYHRVPYTRSIGDHIIQEKINDPDFSETIFGTLDHPSKVFFEDCFLVGDAEYDLTKPKIPKVLSSPKPTTYQHYLEQPDINTTPSPSPQKRWSDKDVPIRGYKNYWHRITSSSVNAQNTWIETGEGSKSNPDKSKSNPDKINPLSVNSTFTGRIRFENLTNEELGALLFAIELPDGLCHKLGMGKPLGLGSVLISINKVAIIDREDRYKKLFKAGSWNLGVKDETANRDSFKNSFAQFLSSKLEGVEYDSSKGFICIWEIDRLMKLKEMLTLKHDMNSTLVEWGKRTRYMENGMGITGVNEFKDRPILPKPDEVVKPDTYKKP